MAKKTTPARHRPRSHTRTQRSAWRTGKQKLLTASVNLTLCQNCGMPHRTHFVCGFCGQFGGEQILPGRAAAAPAPKKVTRVKA